jgi:hypothetical protein
MFQQALCGSLAFLYLKPVRPRMSDPKRHDIFEDENGTRVAVRQIFPPNALGISFVEYKNLTDSNLRFSPQAEFLEKFKWVENFGSTDTHAVEEAQKAAAALIIEAEAQKTSSESEGESAVKAGEESDVEKAEEVRTAKPSRTE